MIRAYFQPVLFVASFLALAGLGRIFWLEWQNKQEKQIQDRLYTLQSSLNQAVQKQNKKTEKGKLNAPARLDKIQRTKDIKQKAADYEKAIKQNHKRILTTSFAMDLADFYYRQEEKEKAKNLLSLFAFPNRSSSLYHLLSLQLSSYYMDEGECKKALPLLKALSANKKASPFHAESALQEALCLENLSLYKQALEKYETINTQNPDSYIGKLAWDYKQLLILKQNLKK